MFKKIAFLSCLIFTTGVSASQDNPSEEFKGNWTASYKLIDGSTLEHTPTYVQLGFIKAGKGMKMSAGSKINSLTFPADLNVDVNMSQEDFMKAVEKSGILKK